VSVALLPYPRTDGPTKGSCGGALLESGPSGDLLARGLAVTPTCSVNYGAAGMRMRSTGPALLSTAERWSAPALRVRNKNLFVSLDCWAEF
jgi:hypothetical protein